MRKKWPTYNDGVLELYKVRDDIGSSFGAKNNVDRIADMTYIDKAAYSLASKRQQDFEFADSLGFSLSLKVKTRYIPGVTERAEIKAVIAGYLYNVSYVDATKTEMWLYLEGVKDIE